jgi:hypothetical protein
MPLKVKKVTIPTIAASVLFNGSNQYLSVANTSTMQMGTSDYTVEAWIYPTANGQANGSNIFGQTASGVSSQFIVFLNSSNKIGNYIEYAAGGGSAGPIITGATSITLNTWTHIATSRVSGVTRIFINGVLDASASDAGGYRVVSHNFSIGSQNGAGSTFFTGYISNLRVIKGTGLYASNFTPTRATLSAVTNTSLLTCHDTSIYDASTNNFTITNNNTATVSTVSPFPVLRSVSFNGSNQYLSIANNAAFNFGTGSFTVEWWQYLNSAFAGSNAIPIGQKTSDGTNGWQIYRNTTVNTDKISVRITGTTDYPTTVTPSSQVWEHWALVRDNGSTLTWYRNGTACGVYSNVTSNISDSGNMNIGYAQTWGYAAASSYISNLRILKGTALYTSNFTPSTTPLTAIANTSLLTCHDTTIRDASTNNFTVTNNNTATVSTVSPFIAASPGSMKFKKTSTGRIGRSVYFTGASQYLYTAASSIFDPGSTGAWTLECWVNGGGTFFTLGNGGPYGVAINCYYSAGKFNFGQANGSSSTVVTLATTNTYAANTWYHFSVCKDASNVIRMFINGVQDGSTTYTGTIAGGVGSRAIFNGIYDNNGFGQYGGTCYVSNARWIKGTALYTASFTVPTAPLTAITNTSLLTCQSPTIIDNSTNNFAITNVNAATVSTTNPFGADTVSGTFKVIKPRGVFMVATGGDLITTSGSYKIHTFTTVGTSSFVVSSLGSTPVIECLLVGGGGGGGGRAMGGGGGGGGVVYTSSLLLATGSFSTIVGAGGIGATGMQASSGQNGGNTLFTYNSITTTVLGGGGGATEGYVGLNGGNGGGGTNGNGAGGSGTGGGFPGGSGSAENYLTRGCGGGGGGAGGAGVRGVQGVGGNGGVGAIYNITGSAYYGGGGGGGGNTNAGGATAGAGGLGGGGLGGRTSPGTAGTANTGGGGGGGGYTNTTGAAETNGGNGGSGIILIKYRYTD